MSDPVPPPQSTSPIGRLKALRAGQTPAPRWDYVDTAGGPETDVHLAEEEISHPETRPLICLYVTDDEGTILGEVWFAPADIPAVMALLQRQWIDNYAPGQRRWLGADDGPPLLFGEPGPGEG